jgi:alpha-1,3-rhamnosyl/mannosyltransferase
VGVNLLWLVPGVVGGSEESTTSTLLALAGRGDADLRITLFALDELARAHPELADRFDIVTLPLAGAARPLRVVGESTWLAWSARRHRVALVHHAGGTMPLLRSVPGALTVHDLQPFDLPENFTRAKRAYLGALVPRSVRAARVVITPSEFVRRSVIERFSVEPSRVRTVHHGVAAPSVGTPVDELRDRFGLPGPFALFPAITYPHKNHRFLVEAFAAVAAAHPDARLVLTGGAAQSEGDVMTTVRRLGLDDHVRRTGRVSTADLAGLYDGATALTFPSTYEGFGLPVLEAMARGCAVIASDAAALPEVVGQAGLLLAPDDRDGWSDAMLKLIEDGAERDRLVTRGIARAAELNWERNAEGVSAALRAALGSP